MKNQSTITLLVLLSMFVFAEISLISGQQLNNEKINDYRNTMLEAWRSYESQSIGIAGTVTQKAIIESKRPRPGYELSAFIKRNKKCMLCEDKSHSQMDELCAVIRNKHYACVLTSRDKGSSWSISQLLKKSEENSNARVKYLSNNWRFNSPIALKNEFFTEIFEHPGFEIIGMRKGVSDVSGNPTIAVKFKIVRDPTSNEYKTHKIHEGTIVVLPDFGFVAESAETIVYQNGEPASRDIYSFEITDTNKGLALLKKIVIQGEMLRSFGENVSKGDRSTLTIECDLEFNKSLPKDSEFTLSSYGIREPDFVPKSNRYVFWGLIATGLFLVFCVGFYAWRKKQ